MSVCNLYHCISYYSFAKDITLLENLDDFVFDANHQNAALNMYVDTLASALTAKMESLSQIGAGKLYQTVDLSIGDFIDDFDRVMQAKFADEARESQTENTHKPLEGATYARIANAVWNRVKHFNKPTPDVWADGMIQGNVTLQDIQKVVDPATQRLLGDYDESWGDIEESDYCNVYMAKQALDKAMAGRSFWWKHLRFLFIR